MTILYIERFETLHIPQRAGLTICVRKWNLLRLLQVGLKIGLAFSERVKVMGYFSDGVRFSDSKPTGKRGRRPLVARLSRRVWIHFRTLVGFGREVRGSSICPSRRDILHCDRGDLVLTPWKTPHIKNYSGIHGHWEYAPHDRC